VGILKGRGWETEMYLYKDWVQWEFNIENEIGLLCMALEMVGWVFLPNHCCVGVIGRTEEECSAVALELLVEIDSITHL
jgi:hypothetical protein